MQKEWRNNLLQIFRAIYSIAQARRSWKELENMVLTNLVGILHMTAGEVGRAPAADWMAHILGGSYENSKQNQHKNGEPRT